MQVVEELGVVYAAHRMRVQSIHGDMSFSMQQRAIRSEGLMNGAAEVASIPSILVSKNIRMDALIPATAATSAS